MAATENKEQQITALTKSQNEINYIFDEIAHAFGIRQMVFRVKFYVSDPQRHIWKNQVIMLYVSKNTNSMALIPRFAYQQKASEKKQHKLKNPYKLQM